MVHRIALIAVLVLCAAPLRAGPVDEKKHLTGLDEKFDRETAEKGVDGWVSYFAANGCMIMGQRPAVCGHEAIRKAMTPVLAVPRSALRWKPKEAGIIVAGQLGYTRGRYESRSKDKRGIAMVAKGTYVSIWQKQPDGSWKVLLDTGYPDEVLNRKDDRKP
jgi:ketosteroid isomerase-like protein